MSNVDEPLVLRNDSEGISTLTLYRPGALNALSPLLFEELRSHLTDINESPSEVGVVVLTG